MIKSEKIYFEGMERELLEALKVSFLDQSCSSRIYHTIANAKKANKINRVEGNEFGVKILKSNDYKELSAGEIDEVVRY